MPSTRTGTQPWQPGRGHEGSGAWERSLYRIGLLKSPRRSDFHVLFAFYPERRTNKSGMNAHPNPELFSLLFAACASFDRGERLMTRDKTSAAHFFIAPGCSARWKPK